MLHPQSGYCVMTYNDSGSSADLNICITLCHWLLHLHLPLVNEADCGHRCRRARTASCLVPLYTKPHPHHTACFKHSDQSKQSLWGVCMHPLTLSPAYTGIVQDSLADGRSRVIDGGMPGGFVFWLAAPSCTPTAPRHGTAWAATLPYGLRYRATQTLDPAMSIGSRCSIPP